MKKVLFTVAIMTFAAGASFAQGKKLTKTTPVNTPVEQSNVVDNTHFLKFNKETHDFGNVKKGDPTSFDFVFTNTSKEPISILSAKSTCGCTVPKYSTDPIMPGKTGSIKVTYDSNRVGPINKPVTITTSAGTKVVHIKGNIEKTPEASVPNNTSTIRTK